MRAFDPVRFLRWNSLRHVPRLFVAVSAALVAGAASVDAQSVRGWGPDELDEVPRAAPEDGGPRNWEVVVEGTLNLRDAPSTRGEVMVAYEPGTLLDNLGCTEAEGRTWCDVQELGGGPRGYVAADFLRPAIAPDGVVWSGPDRSALRAGISDFDARGELRCGTEQSPLTEQCPFGVARSGGGYATVVITRPDGGLRSVYFRIGVAVGVGSSEAVGDTGFEARREGDAWVVWAGRSVYEIPDAVMLGG